MPRGYISASLRQLVIDRAQGHCEYCRVPVRFALESMEIDHILPVSRGGTTIAENLALACHGCNQHKHNKVEGFDSVSSQFAPIYHPREMAWEEHFVWSQDTTLIVGQTAIGRVTIDSLKLNRLGIVNLRRVLLGTGDHPPNLLSK